MSYRNKLTTAPALVNDVINTTNIKRNGSIVTLQDKMETTSHWLDEAITSAKRKIVEGSGVSIQDVKKAKTITFKSETGAPLSPIPDKENSPNGDAEAPRIRVKPPPSAVKRKVNGLRVVDLRKELKSKGMETKGLKKDLQQRLLQAYTTVENIMSPPKAPANNNTSSSNENREPPSDKDFPDSESVEMVVFESASSGQQILDEKEVDHKNAVEKQASDQSFDRKTSKTDVVSDPVSIKATVQEHVDGDTESMEIEPTAQDAATQSKEKRMSVVDCTDGPSAPKANQGLPTKVTMSLDSSKEDVAPEANAGVEPSISEPTDEKHPETKPTLGLATAGRKVSQESFTKKSSLESNQSSTSSKSSAEESQTEEPSREEGATESAATKPAASSSTKDATQEPKNNDEEVREQSPMKRRVQAAIQMFTAKSPAKPKPTTTPGKLNNWLKNKSVQLHPQTEIKATESQKIQHESLKPTSHSTQKVGKPIAANSLRRPVIGLASLNNASSTSAIKSNRLAAGTSNSANEARKARIAEMREKSKPVAKPTSAAKAYMTHAMSSSKSNPKVAIDEKENKRKALNAQMREKAAAARKIGAAGAGLKAIAETSKEVTSAAYSQQFKTNGIPDGTHGTELSSGKSSATVEEPKKSGATTDAKASHATSSQTAKKQAEVVKEPNKQHNAMKQIRSIYEASKQNAQKPAEPGTPNVSTEQDELAMLRPQLLSPMETYEISDREDSGSESEEESESEDESQQKRKKIPDWAQRANLLPALERQFTEGESRVDPDEIFPEVRTCDLGAIFNNKKTRYLKRSSSGNWSRDRVTLAEKMSYKRTMGFAGSQKRK